MAAAQAKLMQASNILKVASFRKITMNKAGNVSDHAAARSSCPRRTIVLSASILSASSKQQPLAPFMPPRQKTESRLPRALELTL
jgi:hypothetical protein